MHALAGARALLSGASSCPGVALLMLCLSCPVQSVHALSDRGPPPSPHPAIKRSRSWELFVSEALIAGLEGVNEMMTKCR